MTSDQKPEDKNAPVLGHSYDGIQEYDNPLPSWWLATFFATIIFGSLYFVHYTVGGGDNQTTELASDLKALPKADTEKVWGEDELKLVMEKPESLKQGKDTFAAKCAACHGAEGQGVIGPNLTDSFWLHGKGSRADLVQIINKGVTEKGMPAWSEMLQEKEVLSVAGFVHSLRGSHPQNPKAPQGEESKE